MSENTKETVKEEENITPQQYFDEVKSRKHDITDGELNKVYDNCLELLNKYKITGQYKAMKKLMFHLDCIEKEHQLVKLGINTFVYRDDVEYYIDKVASKDVKIIELSSFMREIPDEIIDVVDKTKDIFDQFYIVFTDYTGEAEREVEQERREKDPILFGVFQDLKARAVVDRFYYLGDWVDEYCDLTLDKMIEESAEKGKRNIAHTIKTPEDLDELRQQLNELVPDSDSSFRVSTFTHADLNTLGNNSSKKSRFNLFSKIRTFLNK